MKYALALFENEERYVSKEEALDGGRCCLCGELLWKHPTDQRGRLAINRHHLINKAFSEVYKEVTGSEFPANDSNLYWVGMGCHAECHKVIDPTQSAVQALQNAFNAKAAIYERDMQEYRRVLASLLQKYLQAMELLNFGRGFRDEPAPLPGQRVRREFRSVA